jgi:hypothetical protein
MSFRPFALALVAGALLFTGPGSAASAQAPALEAQATVHELYGTVVTVRGDVLSLRLRTGRVVAVDIHQAVALHHVVALTPGRPVHVRGTPAVNAFEADAVLKSHADPQFWPPDR